MCKVTELLDKVLATMEEHGVNLSHVTEVRLGYHCDGETTRPTIEVKLLPESNN